MPDESLIVDTTVRIFQDHADPRTVNARGDEGWQAGLWSALEDMGLTRTWVPERLGGAGAEVLDAFEVLRVAGRFAVAVPLAETLVAAWMLAEAGIEVPPGRLAIAPARPGEVLSSGNGALSGIARTVPFAREADHLVVITGEGDGREVVLLAPASVRIAPGVSIAGEPRDTMDLGGARALAAAPLPPGAIGPLELGAAVRSMQMAGALQAILDLSVEYAGERIAFERPIAKFQAVQHNLARLAGEVAAANAAANAAASAVAAGAAGHPDARFIEVAAAKVRAGAAGHEGSMIAHQTHGAIGYTREHVLHRFTHRLWSWRDDFGAETYWAAELGRRFAAAGADRLWPTLTAI